MRASLCILGTSLGLSVLAGCWQRAAPPPAAPAVTSSTTTGSDQPEPYSGPELRLDSSEEHEFGGGTKGRIWTLSGTQVKELNVKLVVARDGKKLPGTEIACTWDEQSNKLRAQLILLLQDGSPFGAKGKRLPSLTLQFQTGGPDSTRRTSAATPHETLPPRWSTAATSSTISTRELLFAELSGSTPIGKATSFDGTEESLIEASKEGRMVVGVVIDWKR